MRVRDIKRVACASENNILCMYVLYMCLYRKKREKKHVFADREREREKKKDRERESVCV